MPLVLKKNGTIAEFDKSKIEAATHKALLAVTYTPEEASAISTKIAEGAEAEFAQRKEINFNEIHDFVELSLMDESKQAAKAYILYRRDRQKARAGRDDLIDTIASITKETSKDNANIHNSPASKLYEMASAISKYHTLKHILPKKIAQAHENKDIWVNDLDFYQLSHNCLNFDLQKMLMTGFNTPHGFIRPPKSIMSASALAAVLFQSIQNNQCGGVAVDRFDEALAPWAEKATDVELDQAMEGFIFNLCSLHSRSGNQLVFSSVSLGVGMDESSRRVCKSFLKMYLKGLGKGEMAIFPNVIFKVKDGINWSKTDPNYDLLQQALDVATKRMNPTFLFLDASFNKSYGLEASAMG